MSFKTSNIQVFVRIRGLIKKELERGEKEGWGIQGTEIAELPGVAEMVADDRSLSKKGIAKMNFEHAFGKNVSTREIYDTVISRIVNGACEGYNGTIFAYGQTASGKTHSMFGDPGDPGIIPLALDQIFDHVKDNTTDEYLVRCAFMEIYMEQISDLLGDTKNLPLREGKFGIAVEGLKESVVAKPADVLRLIKKGEENRHVGATDMNARSSRSHTIFRLVIERARYASEEEEKAAHAQHIKEQRKVGMTSSRENVESEIVL
jgi:centromeric protein E